ncbi:hypothetical protein LguiA_027830 [Lonicera macranthoides]
MPSLLVNVRNLGRQPDLLMFMFGWYCVLLDMLKTYWGDIRHVIKNSIIHSMIEMQVELLNSSVLAQLGWPDMCLLILYTFPRWRVFTALRLFGPASIFETIEKAVEMFIDEQFAISFMISYLDIFKVMKLTCEKHRAKLVTSPSLEEIIYYELWAGRYVPV